MGLFSDICDDLLSSVEEHVKQLEKELVRRRKKGLYVGSFDPLIDNCVDHMTIFK